MPENLSSLPGLSARETPLATEESLIDIFARVMPSVIVGRSVRVAAQAFVGECALLGDRVQVAELACIGAGVRVEADARIDAGAILAGGQEPATVVRSGASIGAGAVVSAGLHIGQNACIAPGAVVTRSVPPNAIISGNPGQISGYVDAHDVGRIEGTGGDVGARVTAVRGVTLHRLPEVEDLRGNLSVGEIGADVPFEVKRYFLVHGVPNMEIRGEHAHRQCHQFLIAVHGSIRVVADDGVSRAEFVLDRPSLGLHLPPMTWGIQYRYSADAVLLVLASHHYDGGDYIRDHDEFLTLVHRDGGH